MARHQLHDSLIGYKSVSIDKVWNWETFWTSLYNFVCVVSSAVNVDSEVVVLSAGHIKTAVNHVEF